MSALPLTHRQILVPRSLLSHRTSEMQFSISSALSIVRCAVVVFAMYFGCLSAVSAQSQPCGWMSAQELDKVFPSAAPWRLSVGGAVGACQFMGGKDSSNPVFAINQQFQDSAIAGKTLVRSENWAGQRVRRGTGARTGRREFLLLEQGRRSQKPQFRVAQGQSGGDGQHFSVLRTVA
jgi:hypothetical protein